MATGAIQSASKYANHMSPCNSLLLVRFLRKTIITKIACRQRLTRIQLRRFQAYHIFFTILGIGSFILSLSLSLSLSKLFPHTFAFVIMPKHNQGLSLSSLTNLYLYMWIDEIYIWTWIKNVLSFLFSINSKIWLNKKNKGHNSRHWLSLKKKI